MDLGKISNLQWKIFQKQYPDAHDFLLNASLHGELIALDNKEHKTEWERNRREELINLFYEKSHGS